MAKNRIFELNGKAYDALTGAMLGDAKRVANTAQANHVRHMDLKPVPRGHSVDGIVAISSTKRRQATTPQHVTAHQPQPAKTLMRRAVKPPLHSKAVSGLQAQAALSPVKTKAAVNPKLSSDIVDPMRAHRANGVGRSQAVQHFTAAKPAIVSAPKPAIPAAPAVQTSDIKLIHPPAKAAPVRPGQAANRRARSYATALPSRRRAAAAPVVAASTYQQPVAAPQDNYDDDYDLFADALAHATSHEQTTPPGIPLSKSSRKKRRQILSIAGSVAVFLLLVGFIAFQNKENIELQMASAKAGFSASAPLYKPAGYDLEKLSYASGSVASLYRSANKQTFTVLQKKSNWDSQTLLENFVATSNEDYQGYQSNGRTVYVYGDGNATWVNGGIWYQIKDTGDLPNEQLVKIAASM